jgi:hypothetical protein
MPTGCQTTVTKSITKVAFPSVTFTGSAAVCAGSTAAYSVVKNTGSTYAWSVTGGALATRDSLWLATRPNEVSVVWGAAGAGVLTVTETNATGCATTKDYSVTINPQPKPAIVGNGFVCANASGEVYTTTLTVGNKYTWTIVGGTITEGKDTNTVIVTWDSTGSQSISVTETAPGGCFASSTLPVTIQTYPAPVITGEATACLNTVKTYSVEANADDEYNWTVTGGTIKSGQNTNTINVEWSVLSGSHRVSITQMTVNGCSKNANMTVTVFAIPAPSITGSTTVTNFDQNVAYSTKHDSTNLANTFAWEVEGGEIVSGENTNAITVNWGEDGQGSVSVTETNANGCSITSTKVITINRLSLNKLAFTADITKKISGTPFNVTVQAQSADGTPVEVEVNTPVTVSVKAGEGIVTGSATILAGSSTATIPVTYTNNAGECGVKLQANGPDGMTGVSNSFDLYAQEPTQQARSMTWTSLSSTSIGLKWTNGNGSGRLVLARKSTTLGSTNNPTDGVEYDANSVFGNGAAINGAYAIYNGTDNTVLLTGLQARTRYWFKVFEFNGDQEMGTVNYNTNSAVGNPMTRLTARIPGVGQEFANESEDGSIFMSQISPNPAKDKIHFDIEIAEETPVSVSVLTMDGRSVLNPVNSQVLASGISHPVDINLGKLAAGSYILMVTAGDQMIVESFIVLP